MRVTKLVTMTALAALAGTAGLNAQEPGAGPTSAQLVEGFTDSSRWPTFSGDYSGRRHSPLTQITPENVGSLTPQWTFQSGTMARGRGFETTPLVWDGVLYVTGPNNYAWALDARTGRKFWEYRRELPDDLTYGRSAPVNRGFGMLENQLFMVTLDAHLLALDRTSGNVLWDIELADYRIGYAATMAPLVVNGKVIAGISGGEYPTKGFIDAYDPETGERDWRFYTIPSPDEPGGDTWPFTGVRERVYGVHRGPQRRHRHHRMALPIHAARCERLGLEPRTGSGRHHVGGEPAQSGDGGQPQRVFLCARPRHG